MFYRLLGFPGHVFILSHSDGETRNQVLIKSDITLGKVRVETRWKQVETRTKSKVLKAGRNDKLVSYTFMSL